MARDVEAKYGVRALAELPLVRERFYAFSAERRIEHPALARVLAAAPARGQM